MRRDDLVKEMTARLADAAGEQLVSVVLYGPEAHGDTYRAVSELHLMVVLGDLDPPTLRPLGNAVRWWLGKGQPWPRLFSPELIRDSADVYPIEFLDITRHHRVLHGDDPLAGLEVDTAQLRLQCERELREKLMRLREGYVEARGKPRHVRRLIAASYASFALVWRGCLHLVGAPVPLHDDEVATALCERLELDASPFAAAARLAAGASTQEDVNELFDRYYHELERMVERVDRFAVGREGSAS